MLRLQARDLARLGAAARAASAPDKKAPSGKAGGARAARRVPADGTAADGAPLGRAPRVAYEGPSFAVELDVPPQPKERARTFVDDRALMRAFAASQGDARRFMAAAKRRGDGEGALMRSVTPDATRAFEQAVALIASAAMARAGLRAFTCPLRIVVEFRLEGDPAEWPTAHDDGDLDNLEKSLKDGLNRVVWADDRLLVDKVSRKVCAERSGISLSVCPAPP